ncbi:hypothetical protein [Methylobacter luteus]|uniref:hypothetical protein n=1 Tax=Methylobacter luteus TaxID=415 RepID=UPI0003F5585F|nr:hypothetical protein [Methylobacter luteus]
MTLVEFLAIDAGDCEDYFIALYFMLKGFGIDEDKMCITHVKAHKSSQAHRVLSYFAMPIVVFSGIW